MITVYTAVGYYAGLVVSCLIGFLLCAILTTGKKSDSEKITELKAGRLLDGVEHNGMPEGLGK